jgi:hypothetical protein
MFITRKSLPRRTVLRGLGAAVALPFLESMVPAASAQAPRPPLRFGAVYVPNGAPINRSPVNYWMPEGEAGELKITPILRPLERFRDYTTVVNNLSRAGGTSVTDHAVSSAGWLSGAIAKQTEAEDIRVGVTVDQLLARNTWCVRCATPWIAGACITPICSPAPGVSARPPLPGFWPSASIASRACRLRRAASVPSAVKWPRTGSWT